MMKWKMIVLPIIIVILLAGSIFVSLYSIKYIKTSQKDSDAFLSACSFIQSHEIIIDALGPIEMNKDSFMLISGKLSKSKASFKIRVQGSKGQGIVSLTEEVINKTNWVILSAQFIDEKGNSHLLK